MLDSLDCWRSPAGLAVTKGRFHSFQGEPEAVRQDISPMVRINSLYAFRANTSQDGRQLHVGSVPHFFVCFKVTFFAQVFHHVSSHSRLTDSV